MELAIESLVVKVGGMRCQGCVKSVSNILTALPGVVQAEVSLERGEAAISIDPNRLTRADLIAAIDGGGFEAG